MNATTISLTILLFLFVIIPSAFSTGPAFSGITANADSAETAVNNPAGMTRLKEGSFYGNPRIAYYRSKTDVTIADTGQKSSSADESWIGAPGFFYATPVGSEWAVGIGPYAALGIGSTYDDNWPGRYLMQNWSLTFVGIAPSVAYRLNSKISLGISVPVMYSRLSMDKAISNLQPGVGDGRFSIETDGFGAGVNFGVLYEMTEDTRFGIVYRSKVSMSNEGDPEVSGLTPARMQLLNRFGALNKEISFDTSIPQSVIVGMFHDFKNKWSFSLDALWMNFSEWSIEDVEIGDSQISAREGNFKNIWGVSLGVNYELNPFWTIRSGAFYVTSALDKADRTAFMRLDEMWGVGLGFEYKFNAKRSVGFDLTYIKLGDGKFTQNVPGVGDISGEYVDNYALLFSLSTKW